MVNNQQDTIRNTFMPLKHEQHDQFPFCYTLPAPLDKQDRVQCLPYGETAAEAVHLYHGHEDNCGAQMQKSEFLKGS